METEKSKSRELLPYFFKSILWSYDFSQIDPQKSKKLIIVNSINYGDLRHWRWLINAYGKEEIRSELERVPVTELRSRARRLAEIIFDIKNFNYAPRGTGRKK